MNTAEYINSGILELYVFGNLSDTEMQEVAAMAEKNTEIQDEIISIEKAVISLSYSMAPYLSAANFDRIKLQLIEKHQDVIQFEPQSKVSTYLGWAAAILLSVGTGYFYNQNSIAESQIAIQSKQKAKSDADFRNLSIEKQKSDDVLAVVRSESNTVIALAGQPVAPTAKAKIYWNKTTSTVYVDASGLPEPPEGKEYQIWSLKLVPVLTPTSIGTLANFSSNKSKIFEVENTSGAEAFGITLEPKGGSLSPTMEQLYTLGKV